MCMCVCVCVCDYFFIMNLSYKEELSLCSSSYPVQRQKLLVTPGAAVPP